jgi:hypothetical protein
MITVTDSWIRIRKKYLRIHNTACNMHLFGDVTMLREQCEIRGWNRTNKQWREKKIITVMTCAKKIMCLFSIIGHSWKITPLTFVHHLSVFCDTWHTWFLSNGEHQIKQHVFSFLKKNIKRLVSWSVTRTVRLSLNWPVLTGMPLSWWVNLSRRRAFILVS